MNTSLEELFGFAAVRIAVIGVLAILALFLLAETASIAQNFGRPSTPATDTVTVSASGQATMPPDVARVTATVQHTAATVSEAQGATTKQANAVIAFLKGQGIAEKDMRTLSYSITPQYSYPGPCTAGTLCPSRSPEVTGYQVSESVQVTVHDLKSVGALVSGLGALQVQSVSGPTFGLFYAAAGTDAARADAITKAKEQAQLLATQLGVRLGRLVNFSESGSGSPQPYAMSAGVFEAKAATPVLPTGENTYRSSVSLTYEIR